MYIILDDQIELTDNFFYEFHSVMRAMRTCPEDWTFALVYKDCHTESFITDDLKYSTHLN